MRAAPTLDPSSRASAVGLVLAAVVSVQFGGALAATLLPIVGVAGSVTLRLLVAAVVLLLVARPRIRGRSRGDWATVVVFGLALAAMNTSFYASLVHLPIGVAVTVEFVGPLVLAAVLSRRVLDGVAVVVAAAGVVLISRIVDTDGAAVDVVGLGLALTAGACWAAYILLSARVGARFARLDGLAIALVVASVVVTPFGVAGHGSRLVDPHPLLVGAGVALLSSVLPYSLELLALRRLPAHVFGVLLSLEPAVAALAGFLVLSQTLAPAQLVGMLLVVAASAVVTRRDPADPEQEAPSGPQTDAGP